MKKSIGLYPLFKQIIIFLIGSTQAEKLIELKCEVSGLFKIIPEDVFPTPVP